MVQEQKLIKSIDKNIIFKLKSLNNLNELYE
jgi:hypothetical protein